MKRGYFIITGTSRGIGEQLAKALLERGDTVYGISRGESGLSGEFRAPMILTACFIRLTEHLLVRRKIINMSSGSGSYPAPGMSVYCTAKAGINMFTQCVAKEQANSRNPIEIIAVDPGMVETQMQQTARAKTEQEFEMSSFFKKAFQSGQLQTNEEISKRLLPIIDKRLTPGEIVTGSLVL